uniref:Molybdopterin molybdenumtransferase MoeA n=1 Tax=Caldiarchaeum subterraneum TaxID=311458 RepID=A0A7C5U7L8_CALS0
MRRINQFFDIWEAQKLLVSNIKPLVEKERVHVFESAERVLCEPFIAPTDLPPYDSSHMDGFAVRSADLQTASLHSPISLKNIATCTPGQPPYLRLTPGTTARILTGAYLPEGADAVVPQEEVTVEGDQVIFTSPVTPYQYVDLKGFDVKRGQTLFEEGHRLKMADAVLLASMGVGSIEVFVKPRVGVLAVGDELTDDFGETRRGKVLNTHTHLVKKLVQSCGGRFIFLGIIRDDPIALQETVQNHYNQVHMFLSIAGSSISEKDVSSIFTSKQSTGAFVHGLKLQPGRVGGFGFIGEKPLILLPGLIMSTLNVFMFLAYPAIRRLLHQQPLFYHHRLKAELTETVRFRKYHDFVKVVWVSVKERDDKVFCVPNYGESSGMSIPSRSDGFIIGMPGVKEITEGSKVWVHYPPTL